MFICLYVNLAKYIKATRHSFKISNISAFTNL